MKVETKFDVGNQVFLMHDNKVVHAKITFILISVQSQRSDNPVIKYDLMTPSPDYILLKGIKESLLFKTKEDLLNSL
jgi:hypothetical protein